MCGDSGEEQVSVCGLSKQSKENQCEYDEGIVCTLDFCLFFSFFFLILVHGFPFFFFFFIYFSLNFSLLFFGFLAILRAL